MWRTLTNLQMPTPTIMTDLENKRKALEVQADEVKSNISLEMDDLKKIAKERGNKILIAGGIVAGSYLIYSLCSGGGESKKEENEKFKIGDTVEVKGRIGKITGINGATGKYLVLIGLKNSSHTISELTKPSPVKKKNSKKDKTREKRPIERKIL